MPDFYRIVFLSTPCRVDCQVRQVEFLKVYSFVFFCRASSLHVGAQFIIVELYWKVVNAVCQVTSSWPTLDSARSLFVTAHWPTLSAAPSNTCTHLFVLSVYFHLHYSSVKYTNVWLCIQEPPQDHTRSHFLTVTDNWCLRLKCYWTLLCARVVIRDSCCVVLPYRSVCD